MTQKDLHWRDKPITEKQKKLIAEMREFSEYPLEDSKPMTRGEASDWIDRNWKLAHENPALIHKEW